MRVAIVTPAPAGSLQGNRRTALRYAEILRALGHRVRVSVDWKGEPCDLLIAMHAQKSAASIRRFRGRHPHRALCVVMTGTDLYGDGIDDGAAAHALEAAWRIVVLQPEALHALQRRWRAKARVILQSAQPPASRPVPLAGVFEVCVLGHLRPVKDPFRAALAARLLPATSRIRVTHVGEALSKGMGRRAIAEEQVNPRYRWLGGMSHARAMRHLARARLFVQTSRSEGGSNALAEALVSGVPIVATRVPGAVGMVGPDHPGLFALGDTAALARLLLRAEREPRLLARLRRAGTRLAGRFAPARERAAWRALLHELEREIEPEVA